MSQKSLRIVPPGPRFTPPGGWSWVTLTQALTHQKPRLGEKGKRRRSGNPADPKRLFLHISMDQSYKWDLVLVMGVKWIRGHWRRLNTQGSERSRNTEVLFFSLVTEPQFENAQQMARASGHLSHPGLCSRFPWPTCRWPKKTNQFFFLVKQILRMFSLNL